MINSTERSDILVFNCYLCYVSCFACFLFNSTKLGEISDMSKCFEDFVAQALGFLIRFCSAGLRESERISLLILILTLKSLDISLKLYNFASITVTL